MIILLIVCSYLLGNILTGSILTSLFYKQKISARGSGNPGARNVGRLYGKKAFILTFLGDALKGTLAVVAAKLMGFGPSVELLALLSVVIGHMYPVLYKFRGGKGVSTFIGGLVLFNPLVLVVFISVFIIFYPLLKSFTVVGMFAVLSLPIIVYLFAYNFTSILITCFICGLVILAHGKNIKDRS